MESYLMIHSMCTFHICYRTDAPHVPNPVLSATNFFAFLALLNNIRAAKNLSFITSWEHAKEAELDAGLKKMEVVEQDDKFLSTYKTWSKFYRY
jgi:hypothetical protein